MSHGWRVLPSQGAGSSFLVVEVTFSGVLGLPDSKLRTLNQGCLLGLAHPGCRRLHGKGPGQGSPGAMACRTLPCDPSSSSLCVWEVLDKVLSV